MADADKTTAESGRLIGEDGNLYNQVDLMQGTVSPLAVGLDVNKYPARSGRLIGEDGQLYNMVDLLQGSGAVDWSEILNKPTVFPSNLANISDLSQGPAVADSVGAADIATLEAKVNELLSALRTAGIIAP